MEGKKAALMKQLENIEDQLDSGKENESNEDTELGRGHRVKRIRVDSDEMASMVSKLTFIQISLFEIAIQCYKTADLQC